jgi:hypothetical protein
MKRWSVAKLWTAVIATGLLCAFFASWFIQTAWLGSFPGADRDYYGRWSLVQFLTSVAFLVAMLGFGVALFRRYRLDYDSRREGLG